MNKDEILCSEKYGLNPSLEICTICNKEMGIVLFGKLKDDVEAPKQVCLGHICEDCTSKLKENHERLFLEINDSGITGRYAIISDKHLTSEALERIGEHLVITLEEEIFKEFDS